jgi:hypothetical protein
MEHPLAIAGKLLFYDKEAAAKLGVIGVMNVLTFPAIDIVIKMFVALVTVIGVLHTMYCNAKRLENELKNKKDGKHKSE